MGLLRLFVFAALIGAAGTASAQTAGGPASASPGAMPSDTPLTSGGAVRNTARATPATPAAIGANKPARPRPARARRASHAAPQDGATSQ